MSTQERGSASGAWFFSTAALCDFFLFSKLLPHPMLLPSSIQKLPHFRNFSPPSCTSRPTPPHSACSGVVFSQSSEHPDTRLDSISVENQLLVVFDLSFSISTASTFLIKQAVYLKRHPAFNCFPGPNSSLCSRGLHCGSTVLHVGGSVDLERSLSLPGQACSVFLHCLLLTPPRMPSLALPSTGVLAKALFFSPIRLGLG